MMRSLGLRSVFPRVAAAAVLALSFALVVGMGSPASAQAEVTVDMPNFDFVPATITVPVGTKVTWTHSQMGVPHDVTSDTGVFSSPRRMMMGQTFSYTFTEPGTYPYTCTIHSMRQKGTIVVVAQTAGTVAPAGTARPAATGTGGGAAAPAPTATRPAAAAATVPAVMPRTGSGGTATSFVNEGTGMNWLLLAGGLLVAGVICVGGVRLRSARE